MEAGFEKATSHNLPVVDSTMIFEFYKRNSDFQQPETSNIKTTRATRETYGDNAIGYVQVKRENNICIVKAKLTPEHKVHKGAYNVVVEVDESEEKINQCKCMDCSASQGGCKHSIALLLWLHRRSEEPSVTSVECYWKVSKLAKVGSTLKFATLKDLSKKTIPELPDIGSNVLQAILDEGKKLKCTGTLFQQKFGTDCISNVCLHKLASKYEDDVNKGTQSAEDFLNYISSNVSKKDCRLVEIKTREQRKSSDWFKVRYGRITASKLYEASKCNTKEGSLVYEILGACRPIETHAVKRGQKLEEEVVAEFVKSYELKISQCGIFLKGIFGASPDGLTTTHVIEIKCPLKEKTVKNYIDDDGNINSKPLAQMQLQMFLSNRSKGYFCVAAPDFETTKNVQVSEVDFDEALTANLMKDAERFWKIAVYPKL